MAPSEPWDMGGIKDLGLAVMFCDSLEGLESATWLFPEEQPPVAIFCEALKTVDDSSARHFESEGRGFDSLRSRSSNEKSDQAHCSHRGARALLSAAAWVVPGIPRIDIASDVTGRSICWPSSFRACER